MFGGAKFSSSTPLAGFVSVVGFSNQGHLFISLITVKIHLNYVVDFHIPQ